MDDGLRSWQTQLLPFMTVGIAVLAVVFFVGTFWNYANLHARLAQQEPDIVVAIDKLRASTLVASSAPAPSTAYQDWYMRVVLEDRAMRSRHHQNAAVIETRAWTRFMGFITGMVMVMAGCIFILGKLDAEFSGEAKGAGYEGSLKTNSPGLVLAVVGSVLMAISLIVTVNIEVTDKPVYIADLTEVAVADRNVLPPPRPLVIEPLPEAASQAGKPHDAEPRKGPQGGAATGGKGRGHHGNPGSSPTGTNEAASSPSLPPDVEAELCRQAGKRMGCMP